MINPIHTQYPNETALIGQIVLGYSELDIILCHAGGLALGNKGAVLAALYHLEAESARIEVVNNLVRHIFSNQGLEAKFGEGVGAVRYCRAVRNQYAHAQWADYGRVVFFCNPNLVAWHTAKEGSELPWKATSLALLKEQEAYFEYARKCLMWLEWKMMVPNPKVEMRWPQHMPQPPKHIDMDPTQASQDALGPALEKMRGQ